MLDLFWRLYYPDDSYQDELAERASIINSRPGAVVLCACRREVKDDRDLRTPLIKFELFDPNEPDGRLYKPIWYRQMSAEVRTPGSQFAPINLDAIVAGRAREGQNTVDGTLWITHDGIHWQGCPDKVIDNTMIELQVNRD